MENKPKTQSLHELPPIIADGKAFNRLLQPDGEETGAIYKHRRTLYAHLDTALGHEKPKSKSTYFRWFDAPQTHLVEAYLINGRSNPVKYKRIIAAMQYALGETIKAIVLESRTRQQFYTEKEQEFTKYLNTISHE